MLITDFARHVTQWAPGAPSASVAQAILDAAKQFLTETQVWNEVQQPIPLQANVQTYDMDAPIGARCIAIKDIYAPYLSTGRLRGVTLDELARMMPNWQTAQASGNDLGPQSGSPSIYTRAFDFTTFNLYPMPVAPLPTTNGYLQVHGVYTLLDSATSIPDDVVERYREAIVLGARARLQAMPAQTWTNERQAADAAQQFKTHIFRARVDALHAKTNGNTAVTPRVFGRW